MSWKLALFAFLVASLSLWGLSTLNEKANQHHADKVKDCQKTTLFVLDTGRGKGVYPVYDCKARAGE
jgi:hypothetical protein